MNMRILKNLALAFLVMYAGNGVWAADGTVSFSACLQDKEESWHSISQSARPRSAYLRKREWSAPFRARLQGQEESDWLSSQGMESEEYDDDVFMPSEGAGSACAIDERTALEFFPHLTDFVRQSGVDIFNRFLIAYRHKARGLVGENFNDEEEGTILECVVLSAPMHTICEEDTLKKMCFVFNQTPNISLCAMCVSLNLGYLSFRTIKDGLKSDLALRLKKIDFQKSDSMVWRELVYTVQPLMRQNMPHAMRYLIFEQVADAHFLGAVVEAFQNCPWGEQLFSPAWWMLLGQIYFLERSGYERLSRLGGSRAQMLCISDMKSKFVQVMRFARSIIDQQLDVDGRLDASLRFIGAFKTILQDRVGFARSVRQSAVPSRDKATQVNNLDMGASIVLLPRDPRLRSIPDCCSYGADVLDPEYESRSTQTEIVAELGMARSNKPQGPRSTRVDHPAKRVGISQLASSRQWMSHGQNEADQVTKL